MIEIGSLARSKMNFNAIKSLTF